MVSRHVIFDETKFHFSVTKPSDKSVSNASSSLGPPPLVTSSIISHSPSIPQSTHTSFESSATDSLTHSQSSPDTSDSSNATIPLIVELPIVNDSQPVDSTNIVCPAAGNHPMVTRSKVGIHKPRIYHDVVLDDQEPSSYTEALTHKPWRAAMEEEYNALIRNKTWTLTTLPT